MKRFITVIVAISYLCLSIGITVHYHYCMGKMVEISLLEKDDSHHCSHCGMDRNSSKNNCCKDEHKIIKGVKDQILVKDIIAKIQLGQYILPVKPGNVCPSGKIFFFSTNSMARAHAPPVNVPDCPIYIRLGNFRV